MASITNSREFGPTDEATIAAFERVLNLLLPSDYRVFLLEHNGGIPSPDNFDLPFPSSPCVVETFFGLHDGPARTDLRGHQAWLDLLLPEHLPIGYEQGGNPICLRLSACQRGYVMLWDKTLDEGEASPTTFYELAPTFPAFLDLLY